MGQEIRLGEIVEKMNLKNLTPEVDMVEKEVNVPDVNRPALQLTGFYDRFDSNRVQIIGRGIQICADAGQGAAGEDI